MADSSKTEKATPKKRRDERKRGNVFLSKDAVGFATLLAAFIVLQIYGAQMAENMTLFMEYCFELGSSRGSAGELLTELPRQMVWIAFKTMGPLALAVVLCAIFATFLQTRFLVSPESIKPKFSKINPIEGFKRLFSLRSLIEAAKGILKITILLVIIYLIIKGMFTESSKYLYIDIGVACEHLFDIAMKMLLWILIAFAALAGADFFYQWWEYERQMRMSKQEVKEEYKQLEGNPQIKAKIKEVQRRMARSRMMQQVPQADVVVRNPTHYAVALRYQPEQDSAPMVLAMGQDELALRIVRVAEENGVAVVENVPLARALYAASELNREIPQELYGAVAEVLVYIYRINGKL